MKAGKTIRPTAYDTAQFLTSRDAVRTYMDEALATQNPAFIAMALGTVARAQGMAGVARKTGLSRESLYKALSEKGSPEFATIIRVLEALGLRLSLAAR